MGQNFYKNEILFYAKELENWANKENKTYSIKFQNVKLRLRDIISSYELKNIDEIKIYNFLVNAFSDRLLKEIGEK